MSSRGGKRGNGHNGAGGGESKTTGRGGRGGRGRGRSRGGGEGGRGGKSGGRERRAKLGAWTLEICKAGSYTTNAGEFVSIADDLKAAVAGSVLYSASEQLDAQTAAARLAAAQKAAGVEAKGDRKGFDTTIEVTGETTLACAHRLTLEGHSGVAALNFASAKNPGGGFLTGAGAQEESLARSSGLYVCQTQASCKAYYSENAKDKTCVYTHNLIYSPRVPVFRNDAGDLLSPHYLLDMITCPAVNAGVSRSRLQPQLRAEQQIEELMRERCARVLASAVLHGAQKLILGAFGCGVFKNSPKLVAGIWRELLRGVYKGRFRHVAFAIYGDDSLPTFQEVLADCVTAGAGAGGAGEKKQAGAAAAGESKGDSKSASAAAADSKVEAKSGSGSAASASTDSSSASGAKSVTAGAGAAPAASTAGSAAAWSPARQLDPSKLAGTSAFLASWAGGSDSAASAGTGAGVASSGWSPAAAAGGAEKKPRVFGGRGRGRT